MSLLALFFAITLGLAAAEQIKVSITVQVGRGERPDIGAGDKGTDRLNPPRRNRKYPHAHRQISSEFKSRKPDYNDAYFRRSQPAQDGRLIPPLRRRETGHESRHLPPG